MGSSLDALWRRHSLDNDQTVRNVSIWRPNPIEMFRSKLRRTSYLADGNVPLPSEDLQAP